MPHEHEAVQRVDALIGGGGEIEDGLRRDALRLGRAARQGKVGGGCVRLGKAQGGQENE